MDCIDLIVICIICYTYYNNNNFKATFNKLILCYLQKKKRTFNHDVHKSYLNIFLIIMKYYILQIITLKTHLSNICIKETQDLNHMNKFVFVRY